MERFENAQTNDLVYCRQNGPGQIGEIGKTKSCPIKVYFKDCEETYTYCGRINQGDSEPLLFYRKGEDLYLTERPEPEIDWENEKPGTRFEVSQDGISYSQKTFAGILSIGDDHFPVFLTATLCDTYQYWNHIRRIK